MNLIHCLRRLVPSAWRCPAPQSRRDPAPRTVVAVCSQCRRSFLAYRGPVDDFDPRTIMMKGGKLACPRCRGANDDR